MRAPRIDLTCQEGIRKILIVSCVLGAALLQALPVHAVETLPGKQLLFFLLRQFKSVSVATALYSNSSSPAALWSTQHNDAMYLAQTLQSCKPDECRVAELHGESCAGGEEKFLSIPQSTKSARGCSARLTQASSLWKDTRLNMPNAVWGKKALQQRQPKGPSPDGVDCSKFTAIAFKMGVTLIAWFFPFDYSLPLRVRGAKCSLQVKNFFFGVYYLMAAYSCWSHALNH